MMKILDALLTCDELAGGLTGRSHIRSAGACSPAPSEGVAVTCSGTRKEGLAQSSTATAAAHPPCRRTSQLVAPPWDKSPPLALHLRPDHRDHASTKFHRSFRIFSTLRILNFGADPHLAFQFATNARPQKSSTSTWKESETIRVLVDDSVVPKLDIGDRLGSGPIGISIGIRYRVPTP